MKFSLFLALCVTATGARLRERTTRVTSSAFQDDPDDIAVPPDYHQSRTTLDSHERPDRVPQPPKSTESSSDDAAADEGASDGQRQQQGGEEVHLADTLDVDVAVDKDELKGLAGSGRLTDNLNEKDRRALEEALPNKLNKGETPREKASHSLFLWTVVTAAGFLVMLFIIGFATLVLKKTPTVSAHNLYDRVMLHHVHKQFASNFELAGRGAICCVLVGLPFFMPRGFVPFLDWLVEEGLYSPSAVIYYIYTLYKTVGDTVYFARCGTLGTILAVCDCWLLYGLKPSGVEEVHYSNHWINHTARFWLFGVFHNTLVTFFIFWFNMDGLTRVFFLSTAVWFWMDFLNPDNDDNYSKGFVINPNGSGTRMLADCVVGCLFAIVAVVFPRPFWAISRAREGVSASVAMMEKAWGELVQAVCVDQLSEDVQESVIFRLRQVQVLLAEAKADLDTAYYECFRMGSREQSRKMLRAVIKATEESDAQIQSTLCCLGTTTKSEFMANSYEGIDSLIKRTSKVMSTCADAALRGGLTEDDESLLLEAIASMDTSISEITKTYVKYSSGAANEKGMDDNTFLASVCCYGNIVKNLAQRLLKDHDGSEKLTSKVLASTLATTFDWNVLKDKDHILESAKDTFKILLGFWVGYFGYMSVIPMYSAGVASTMSLLLGSFAGSALVKNMGRLQGVVFGMVVGQIFYAAFGWCSWWGYLGVMASMFGLVALGLFLYYNSTEHGTLGCLLAAFGAQVMLSGCKESGNHIDRSAYYTSILLTVVAVLLVCGIDMICTRTRASNMAYEALVKAWKDLDYSFNCVLDPTKPKRKRASGALRAGIAGAEQLAAEAAKEPRFWRTPFRSPLFARVIKVAYDIRFSLSLAEFVATVPDGSRRNVSAYNKVVALPSFIKVRELLLKKMRQVELHFELFLHETDHQKELTPKSDQKQEFHDALQVLFKDLAKNPELFKDVKELSTVEDSTKCQVSVVLNAAESIMAELCDLDTDMYNSSRASMPMP